MYVENTSSMREHILGDSGYMLRPYLLTPYHQPTSSPQSNYNYSHMRTRVIIEQTSGLRMNPDEVCSIIVPYGVLYNIAIQ